MMDFLIVCTFISVFYFLPSIIARRHPYGASIFVLNLFLGWTLLGWVIALVWAVSSPRQAA